MKSVKNLRLENIKDSMSLNSWKNIVYAMEKLFRFPYGKYLKILI